MSQQADKKEEVGVCKGGWLLNDININRKTNEREKWIARRGEARQVKARAVKCREDPTATFKLASAFCRSERAPVCNPNDNVPHLKMFVAPRVK